MSLATVLAAEGPGWPNQLPLLPHPTEMITGVIAFAVLYWLYARIVVPRMEAMYEARTAAIEGGMKQAEQAQAEAAAALAQYKAQLAEAREEAARIREEARADGAAIIAEMREQAQAEANRITAAAQQHIQAERQQAVVQLRSEVGGMATRLAERIVGESLTGQVPSNVVDRFLAELDAVAPAGSGH